MVAEGRNPTSVERTNDERGSLMKTKTLRILAGCAVLFSFLALSDARAAGWEFCESNPSGHLYYDKSGIVKTGDIARVRTMTIFSEEGKAELYAALRKAGRAPGNPEMLSYSITTEEFDCAKKKMKLTSLTIYNEKGGSIHSSVVKDAGWDDIRPGTNGGILGNIACGGLR